MISEVLCFVHTAPMTSISFFGPLYSTLPGGRSSAKAIYTFEDRGWRYSPMRYTKEAAPLQPNASNLLYSNGFMMMVSQCTHVPLGTMPATLSSKCIDRISYTRVCQCPVMVSWHTCPSHGRGDDGRPQLSTKAPISYSALDSCDYASVGESSPTPLTRGWRQSAGGLVSYQSSYLVKPQEPARSPPPSHPNT